MRRRRRLSSKGSAFTRSPGSGQPSRRPGPPRREDRTSRNINQSPGSACPGQTTRTLSYLRTPLARRASHLQPGGRLWHYGQMKWASCSNTTTGTTIFGASWHGELKTLAIIVDAVAAISRTPQGQPHHLWVVIDAAVDLQIVPRLARQPLHKGTDSSLGTQVLHLWVPLRNLPGRVVLHLMKQGSHCYNLGNEHIDLHAHNQLGEQVPTPDEPPLHDHMHTHLQHLSPVPHPGEPPP